MTAYIKLWSFRSGDGLRSIVVGRYFFPSGRTTYSHTTENNDGNFTRFPTCVTWSAMSDWRQGFGTLHGTKPLVADIGTKTWNGKTKVESD
ncbi:hypothetical protein TNIN_373581 [Trichonephila inaurata madagascariensis]|uniref:Uncharacterized protein n=1 Tax=Trichonephila inaurata madagascariensis TaxID=2747483 RepID=A0A8X7C4H8_9ARAC|nr:hypothetical protein TNIN_373581 [Trichonephila inaurata madagascariensis]